MGYTLVNLQRHEISVWDKDRKNILLTLPKYEKGDICRCIVKYRTNHLMSKELGVRIEEQVITSPKIPNSINGVRYVVNNYVAQANPGRRDLLLPKYKKKGDVITYEESQKCIGFYINPYYRGK